MLRALYQHRLLTSAQMQFLLMPDLYRSRFHECLQPLVASGLISYVHERQPGSRKLWYLAPAGARLVMKAAAHGIDERPYPITDQNAAGGLQAHTIAVNEVALSFVRTARKEGDECEVLSWRHEVSHLIADSRSGRRAGARTVQSDAVLRYVRYETSPPASKGTERTIPLSYFLELDAGTEPVEDVVEKVYRYATLYRFRARGEGNGGDPREPSWRALYPEFPQLVIVFKFGPRARSDRLLQRRLRNVGRMATRYPLIASALEDGMHVSCATFEALCATGPMAPVFLSLPLDSDQPDRVCNMLSRPPESC